MIAAEVKPRFVVAYRGESEFRVQGKLYRVRSWASDGGYYQPGVFEREIVPTVGAIVGRSCTTEFPPEEVCALFPSWVPARWDCEKGWVYKGDPPQTRKEPGWFGHKDEGQDDPYTVHAVMDMPDYD